MTLTLELSPELEARLEKEAGRKGLPADELTLSLLEEYLPPSSRSGELVHLLQSWIDEEDPAEGQQEQGNDLLLALDQHRPSHRKLFPPELEGKTW